MFICCPHIIPLNPFSVSVMARSSSLVAVYLDCPPESFWLKNAIGLISWVIFAPRCLLVKDTLKIFQVHKEKNSLTLYWFHVHKKEEGKQQKQQPGHPSKLLISASDNGSQYWLRFLGGLCFVNKITCPWPCDTSMYTFTLCRQDHNEVNFWQRE